MGAEFEFQKALYSVLSADATLAAIGARIVDFGPSDEDAATIFPYVSIGDASLAEWDTGDTTGFNVLVRVHSYSAQSGVKETKAMQSAIYAALHLQALSVTGYETILFRREDSSVMRTSRGAFHGICEYRGYLDKA